MRLPSPYRPEADIVSHRLASLKGALDWAAIEDSCVRHVAEVFGRQVVMQTDAVAPLG